MVQNKYKLNTRFIYLIPTFLLPLSHNTNSDVVGDTETASFTTYGPKLRVRSEVPGTADGEEVPSIPTAPTLVSKNKDDEELVGLLFAALSSSINAYGGEFKDGTLYVFDRNTPIVGENTSDEERKKQNEAAGSSKNIELPEEKPDSDITKLAKTKLQSENGLQISFKFINEEIMDWVLCVRQSTSEPKSPPGEIIKLPLSLPLGQLNNSMKLLQPAGSRCDAPTDNESIPQAPEKSEASEPQGGAMLGIPQNKTTLLKDFVLKYYLLMKFLQEIVVKLGNRAELETSLSNYKSHLNHMSQFFVAAATLQREGLATENDDLAIHCLLQVEEALSLANEIIKRVNEEQSATKKERLNKFETFLEDLIITWDDAFFCHCASVSASAKEKMGTQINLELKQ